MTRARRVTRARLIYRPVGESGDPWPDWVRQLKHSSGVYAIRSRRRHIPLYVGESHRKRLYDTLTRHFQSWSGPKAGPTYDRSRVEVAIRLTRTDNRADTPPAVREQDRLIRRLRPRDNRQIKDTDPALTGETPF